MFLLERSFLGWENPLPYLASSKNKGLKSVFERKFAKSIIFYNSRGSKRGIDDPDSNPDDDASPHDHSGENGHDESTEFKDHAGNLEHDAKKKVILF